MSRYNEDTQLYVDMISRFLEQEVAPHYEQWEKDHITPKSFWKTMGEAGLLGIDMPEKFGGSGVSMEITQAALYEISRHGYGGLAGGYNIHANIVMPYILHIGTEEQQHKWLPSLVTGEAVGAIAMTEPGAGSDLAAMRTTAERTDQGWLLNGSKVFITNGINADVVIVAAKTDSKAGAKGVSLFLVDASTPGFSRGKSIDKIGMHSSDTAELFFSDMLVPHDSLLGEEGKGFIYLMQELPRERLGVAAQALGAAQGSLDVTVEYVQERKAFGQRVGDFQNTRFKLAEAKANIEMGQAYLDHCIAKYLQGTMDTTDAAVLKLKLTEIQCEVADECLQLFGGYGFTVEYPISRFYADARVQKIYAGTSEIMKEVIARSILGK